MKQITVLSLFDGISCARVALERLGYDNVLYLAAETDKYATAITRYQWPDTIHLGDVCKIRRDDLPVHIDLMIGGSPCQDLSIAKANRKGLDGARSGLFWEWVRLWKECQPRYWVLENVNSMPKKARQIISDTLGVEPVMINAALVSAQNRKRLFWTNIKTDMFGNCHIPQPEDRGIMLKHILESGRQIRDKAYTIDHNYWRTPGKQENISQAARRKQVIDTSGKSHPINATYWKAGTSPVAREYSDRTHQRTLVVDNIYPGGGQNGNIYDTAGKSPTLSAGTGIKGRGIGSSNAPKVAEPVDNTNKPIRVGDIGSKGQAQRVYSKDGKSVTLSATGGGQGAKTGLYAIPEARGVAKRSRGENNELGKQTDIGSEKANSMTSVQTDSMVATPALDGYTIRKLTPIECERLMTLSDDYTAMGDFGDGIIKPISNTQRYKTLGNGFVVEVVAHILKYMEEK